MTSKDRRSLAWQAGIFVVAIVALLVHWTGAQTAPVDLDHLPTFKSGIRQYPTPWLAIARTPHPIASPQGGGMGIESDVGFLSGFSGFVDESNGNFGFPGYRNHSILNFAFDQDKLVIQTHVPYPEGRALRAHPTGNLADDDIFELLIQPRTRDGVSKGKIYRVMGNAFGHWVADIDLPIIGQFHQTWDSGIHYGSMLWDPTGGWMSSIAIPWDKIGGKPADGDTWGVQFAVRYPDPKITAFLSPTDDFTDASRFARIRFDFNRRLNYREHWLSEEVKTGRFSVGYLLANGGDDPQTVQVNATCYSGSKELGHGSFEKTCPPGGSYWADNSNTYVVIGSQPATPADRNTVAHIQVYDQSHDHTKIFDQWVPYWQMKPGERDWLKTRFGKDFTFNIGPYPSLGIFDYAVDAQTLCESNKAAKKFECVVVAGGKEIKRDSVDLPADGKIHRSISLGTFTDGTKYDLKGTIEDASGASIAEHTESFTRHIMPFEKADPAGYSDIVIPPFTPPMIDGASVSCWGRTYKHGADGLLESLIAADDDLLLKPAAFIATLGDGKTVTLTGDTPQLKPHSKGAVDYHQTFRGGGIVLQVDGLFDYDGFYRFHTTYGPDSAPVDIKDLHLEIPVKSQHATLIDAATSSYDGAAKSLGSLSTQTGRIWDSFTYRYQEGDSRTSNMPPWIWIGDDERGLCFSQQSDQGTHNDRKLPAVALDRTDNAVTMSIWLVNQPFQLTANRSFEFALQASPFKPQPANVHLWRNMSRGGGTYKNGVYFTNFWNPANYPTYGRWVTLDFLKEEADKDGCDRTGMEASALSECSGTPEYEQFYYEWGSGMDQFKRLIPPMPDDMRTRFKDHNIDVDPWVMVEAFSNGVKSNQDYRVWWLSEAAKRDASSFVYQDNGTWVYTNRPDPQYGYIREDGGREPTSMIWNSRTLMKRFAHAVTEAGQPSQPATYPNLMSPVLPGRAFCGKALTGEYTNSDQLRMDMLRVHLSKQWGIATDWLCQSPSNAGAIIGTTQAYWRALYSEILLFDITNFSRDDSAEIDRKWYNALDIFWLDDPSVKWHPYYKNPTLDHVDHPATTLVSTYTANGRALAVISNQDKSSTIETVKFKDMDQFGAASLKYFYDAETGEEIETTPQGALHLFIRGHDYRVVIGFTTPWSFAAKNRLPNPADVPAQSTLDANQTIGQICRNLLVSRDLPEMPGSHKLTELWAREILKQLPADNSKIVYLDAKGTASVDLGDPRIQCSVFYDRPADIMLIAYSNGTDLERDLPGDAREKLCKLVGKTSFNYVYDVIGGDSQWEEIDVPAHGGRWELLTPDANIYGHRNGRFKIGTYMSNIMDAIHARKLEMEGTH
jgi:Family of unknown function (DUF6067)